VPIGYYAMRLANTSFYVGNLLGHLLFIWEVSFERLYLTTVLKRGRLVLANMTNPLSRMLKSI
jgi:hypothetical protein